MKAELFEGAWYADALPNGEYAVLFRDREIWTHAGKVPLPTQNVLYVRVAPGRLAGVGHRDDFAWEFTHGDEPGGGWRAIAPAVGVNAVAYDNNGALIINDGHLGSQGIRYFDGANNVVTGDATYFRKDLLLNEWTELDDVIVGQDNSTDEAIIIYHGARRKLSDKRCRFIRFEKWGVACSVAIWREGYADALIVWFDVSEIGQFPLVSAPPPVVGEPEQIVKAVRAKYPTPLGMRHAEFLLEVAAALKMGLLRKTGGTRIALPDGVEVSQDIVMDPVSGRIFDILGDGEGAAVPGWGEAAGSPQPLERLYKVGPGTPPPPPPTDPPVDDTVEELVRELGRHLGAWK